MKTMMFVAIMFFGFNAYTFGQIVTIDIAAFAVSQTMNQYAVGSKNLEIQVYDLSTNILKYSIQAPDLRLNPDTEMFSISDMAYSDDGTRLAVSFGGNIAQGSIIVVDTLNGGILHQISTPAPVNTIDWSPDGLYLVGIYSFNQDTTPSGFIALWDSLSGDIIREGYIGTTSPLHVEWNPELPLVAYTSLASVVLWDVDNWLLGATVTADEIGVTSVSWNQSGDKFATIGMEGYLRIWDATTGKEDLSIAVPIGDLSLPNVAWLSDNILMFVQSDHVQVYDVNTKELLIDKFKEDDIDEIYVDSQMNLYLISGNSLVDFESELNSINK